MTRSIIANGHKGSAVVLERLQIATNEIEVLVYNGDEHDIAWLLQGIRHISGIKAWKPAQRARLVAQQIDKGLSITEAGQKFGMSPQRAGRYYRAYKALEQMRGDEDFQSKAKNEYFTLFDEAYGNTTIRKWLEWNEAENAFQNIENLRHFYSWITPDEEFGDKRRIHDPSHIKKLATLIAGSHDNLMNAIDVHETTIDSAFDQASDRGNEVDWRSKSNRSRAGVTNLKIAMDTSCGFRPQFLHEQDTA